MEGKVKKKKKKKKSPVALNTETVWRVEAKKKARERHRVCLCGDLVWCANQPWAFLAQSLVHPVVSPLTHVGDYCICEDLRNCSNHRVERKKKEEKKNSLEEKKQDRKCSDAKSDSGERRSEIFICTSWLGIRLKENILWQIMFLRQGIIIFPQWVLNFFWIQKTKQLLHPPWW